jgi:hypothetical protein
VAKKKKRAARSTVAAWVRKLPHEQRQERLASLNLSIKLLRKYYNGFSARDGFSLNELKALPLNRAEKVSRMAQRLRATQSRPTYDYRPRSPRSKEVLRTSTGQRDKKQKVFPVHVPQIKEAKSKVRIRGRKLEFETQYKDAQGKEHTRTERNYYFVFPKKTKTWNDILSNVRKLVARLPAGYYRIVSSLYDTVGPPIERENLLLNMQDWFDRYSGVVGKDGMAQTLIGVRWIARDSEQASPYVSMNRRQTEEHQRRQRSKRERERRALIRRHK